jgi:hypothetical protein
VASKKPTVKKYDHKNHLTPDVEVTALVKLLSKKVFEDTETKTSNEFVGKISYKLTGNRKTKGASDPGFELLQLAVADPFRDPDVDRERVRSKGIVDKATIEDRNVLYLQSEQMYHVLYLAKKEEDPSALASFLLRVPYNVKSNNELKAEKGNNLIFSFKDRANLRDPWIVRKPNGQKEEVSVERKPKNK